jgi:hypothetical protein
MGKGYDRKKGGKGNLPFVQLYMWVLRTPAWQDLDPVAKALYLALKERFNGHNNGTIGLGCREAADTLNVGNDTASRAFKSLEAHGFIAIGANSTFNQKRLTREWRLTELPDNRTGALPSKDFVRWTKAPPSKKTTMPPEYCGNVIPLRGNDNAA